MLRHLNTFGHDGLTGIDELGNNYVLWNKEHKAQVT